MQTLSIKTRLLLLSLSLFYNAAFVDKVWTDPKMRRTVAGVAGIILMGVSAAVYSIDRIFFSATASPYSDLGILFGLLLFLLGAWRGGMVIAFDLQRSRSLLRSRRTVLGFLGDPQHSSAYVESLIAVSEELAQNDLNASEAYLKFAAEIWAESLARKGLIMIENMLENGNLGDILADKSFMSSM